MKIGRRETNVAATTGREKSVHVDIMNNPNEATAVNGVAGAIKERARARGVADGTNRARANQNAAKAKVTVSDVDAAGAVAGAAAAEDAVAIAETTAVNRSGHLALRASETSAIGTTDRAESAIVMIAPRNGASRSRRFSKSTKSTSVSPNRKKPSSNKLDRNQRRPPPSLRQNLAPA